MTTTGKQRQVPKALYDWVNEIVRTQHIALAGADELQLIPLPGDAGFRRYFRLNSLPALLAVHAPIETEDSGAFVRIAEYLRKNGVHVPKVSEYDLEQGYLLIEDLGTSLYREHLDTDTADALYGEALMMLLRIQQSPIENTLFPPYDETRLRDEMKLFDDWFVTRMLDYSLSPDERRMLDEVYEALVRNATEQPQVVVHRDYHSRNIVYGGTGGPGIIDFQDAVIGPVTYDLVSLLKDCYIQWDPARVKRWALAYANMVNELDIIPDVPQDTFMRWFDWMGLQRHIKVLGIFSRLSMRDNKHGYLNDLPLVVHYVRSVLAAYPQFDEFSQWFESHLVPLIEAQSWTGAKS